MTLRNLTPAQYRANYTRLGLETLLRFGEREMGDPAVAEEVRKIRIALDDSLRGWVIARISEACTAAEAYQEQLRGHPIHADHYMKKIVRERALAEAYAKVVEEIDRLEKSE